MFEVEITRDEVQRLGLEEGQAVRLVPSRLRVFERSRSSKWRQPGAKLGDLMNFQQLRIIHETVRRNFNLTEVANALFTSQSGVSKHIKDLEDELGPEPFIRAASVCSGLPSRGRSWCTRWTACSWESGRGGLAA